MAFTSKILLRSNSRDTKRAFATLLTGSSTVDVLTSGGYPAGAIVELQAPKREPSWLVAWLAAAAARQRDGVILACGCKEFLRFGKDLGVANQAGVISELAVRPDTLLWHLSTLRARCSLVLVDSITEVARNAAPAGPDPQETRGLRARRLGRFLQQLSLQLRQAPSRLYHRHGWGHEREPLVPSVLVCNVQSAPLQDIFSKQLQQYATLRLRLQLQDARKAPYLIPAAREYVKVELLKAPSITSRIQPPATELWLEASSEGIKSIIFGDGFMAALDFVLAAQQLGMIHSMKGAYPAEGSGVEASVVKYRSWEARSITELADVLARSGLVPVLRREVDAAVHLHSKLL